MGTEVISKETKIDNLKSVIEELGFICSSYSGRGMYGKKCLGLSIHENIFGAIADIITFYTDLYGTKDNDFLIETFYESDFDNMGLGYIVYFPKIEWIWDEDQP